MAAALETPPGPAGREPAGREPAWRALAIGWLLARAVLAGAGSLGAAGAPGVSGPRAGDLSPRALRSWPGIGETRALAIARARWEHPADGPPLLLSDVPGIGAATERGVRAWLDGAGGPATGSGAGERAVHSLSDRNPQVLAHPDP